MVTAKADDDRPALDQATDSRAAEGSAVGAATGAGVGALWALGIAAASLPALGVGVGGPLMALLASAGAGATIGPLVGGLAGLGIPSDEASYSEQELRAGHTLVTVDPQGRDDAARAILSRHGAYDFKSRA